MAVAEPTSARRAGRPKVEAEWMATMHDLKTRLTALLDTPEGKALIEQGRMFSAEELHAAFAQLLAATDGEVREVINAALDALMARRAH
jgi:hypothetical protein